MDHFRRDIHQQTDKAQNSYATGHSAQGIVAIFCIVQFMSSEISLLQPCAPTQYRVSNFMFHSRF